METTQLNQIRREVGGLMRELLVHLTQQDGRPITGATIAQVREFGLKCYLQGLGESQRMVTIPAPPSPPSRSGVR